MPQAVVSSEVIPALLLALPRQLPVRSQQAAAELEIKQRWARQGTAAASLARQAFPRAPRPSSISSFPSLSRDACPTPPARAGAVFLCSLLGGRLLESGLKTPQIPLKQIYQLCWLAPHFLPSVSPFRTVRQQNVS